MTDIHLHHRGNNAPNDAFFTYRSESIPQINSLITTLQADEIKIYKVTGTNIVIDRTKEEGDDGFITIYCEVQHMSGGGYDMEVLAR